MRGATNTITDSRLLISVYTNTYQTWAASIGIYTILRLIYQSIPRGFTGEIGLKSGRLAYDSRLFTG